MWMRTSHHQQKGFAYTTLLLKSQAAVPKFIQLQLQPATGATLTPNNPKPVQQRIILNNTQV